MKHILHRLIAWFLGPSEPLRCDHGLAYASCHRHRRYGGGWPF